MVKRRATEEKKFARMEEGGLQAAALKRLVAGVGQRGKACAVFGGEGQAGIAAGVEFLAGEVQGIHDFVCRTVCNWMQPRWESLHRAPSVAQVNGQGVAGLGAGEQG